MRGQNEKRLEEWTSDSMTSESTTSDDVSETHSLFSRSPYVLRPLAARDIKKERLSKRSRQCRDSSHQLHKELEDFSDLLKMDAKETRRKREIVQIVTDTSYRLFKTHYHQLEVYPYGSFMNGLATKRSNVNIVLCGMLCSKSSQNEGCSQADREKSCEWFQQLINGLRIPLKSSIHAEGRVPLLKLRTEDDIDVEISLGNDSGPRAAKFIQSRVKQFPPVRPLVLVLRYILQSNALNDVATSGLGTYALAIIVIAFITNKTRKHEDLNDFGSILIEALHFYGFEFDYEKQAISLFHGAFCDKAVALLPKHPSSDEEPGSWRLYIEDYMTGHNICQSNLKLLELVSLFRRTYEHLIQYSDPPCPSEHHERLIFPLLSRLPEFHSSFQPTTASATKKESDLHQKDDIRVLEQPKLVSQLRVDRADEDCAWNLQSVSRQPTVSEIFATVFLKTKKKSI